MYSVLRLSIIGTNTKWIHISNTRWWVSNTFLPKKDNCLTAIWHYKFIAWVYRINEKSPFRMRSKWFSVWLCVLDIDYYLNIFVVTLVAWMLKKWKRITAKTVTLLIAVTIFHSEWNIHSTRRFCIFNQFLTEYFRYFDTIQFPIFNV